LTPGPRPPNRPDISIDGNSAAIRDDLRAQTSAFELLRDASGVQGKLTDLRLLDIVAWSSKGVMPA